LTNYDPSQLVLPSRPDLDALDLIAFNDSAITQAIKDAIQIDPPRRLRSRDIDDRMSFMEALTDPSAGDLRFTVPPNVPSGLPPSASPTTPVLSAPATPPSCRPEPPPAGVLVSHPKPSKPSKPSTPTHRRSCIRLTAPQKPRGERPRAVSSCQRTVGSGRAA
jgi:hypothetical protein